MGRSLQYSNLAPVSRFARIYATEFPLVSNSINVKILLRSFLGADAESHCLLSVQYL